MWLARSRGAGLQLLRGFYCAARLFVAVSQFGDVAPFTGPSVPGPLFDRPSHCHGGSVGWKPTPAMPHILALHPELVTFCLAA